MFILTDEASNLKLVFTNKQTSTSFKSIILLFNKKFDSKSTSRNQTSQTRY